MKGFRQWKWHLAEVYVTINGWMHYLRRAVDQEGEMLRSYVTKARDKQAALTFMKKALSIPTSISWLRVGSLLRGDDGLPSSVEIARV
jgi:hypothetical protein